MARMLLLAALLLAVLAVPAAAQDQPWIERRVINMTHQGGEDEHPSGTMYAFRESLALGADTLELDVQPTKDGHLMVLHDASVERTTGVDRSVYDMTRDEVQQLDAAFNFVPGEGTVRDQDPERYPFRGVRTEEQAPPLGYTADDFRIPTLEEVLRAFPDVPMNIEIKGRSDADRQSFLDNAYLLVDLLRRVPRPPLVVVSFDQAAVDRFHAALPEVPVAPGIVGVAAFLATSIAPPGTQALQVPPSFSGITIMTPDFVARAHAAGHAVHVWFSGQEESERVYNAMLDMGADGLMPAKPRALERVLCARNEPRPPGNPNHCDGGAAHAAEHCDAGVRKVSRVRRGRVTLDLRRGDAGFACAGRVRLRGAQTRFKFPYGIRRTQVTLRVTRKTRKQLPLRAVARVRVGGADGAATRRVRLRR